MGTFDQSWAYLRSSFSRAHEEAVNTWYLTRTSCKPFGPIKHSAPENLSNHVHHLGQRMKGPRANVP